MRLKKNPKADLENKRGLFFEIGLLVTLLVVLLVFGIGSRERSGKTSIIKTEDFISGHAPIEFIEIPRFSQPDHHIVVQERVIVPVVADMFNIVNNNAPLTVGLTPDDFSIENEFENADLEQELLDSDGDLWDEELIDEDMPVIMSAGSMPLFGNGDLNVFRRWVASQFRYPEKARQKTIQGIVTVEFYVEKDGRISDVRILSSPDELLSIEVIRVVSESPLWVPGLRDGIPAKFKYIMDVDIRLAKN